MAVHLLGIRHHGPGSARNVVSFLKKTKPDMILVEGPPEAEPLLQSVVQKEMKPPVALLAYNPENPKQAVFYPFAEFSAEWQAIYYGTENNIPVRFFDMPLVHSFAMDKPKEEEKQLDTERSRSVKDDSIVPTEEETEVSPEHRDPFSYLAEAEGYSDGELWWELHFESRNDNENIFEAAKEAVSALRESFPGKDNRREKLREAFMRRGIRVAQKEGYNNIVVVCGAWHVPALDNMPAQKEDNDLIKGLPKTKAEVTWIPWTYNRLTFRSGYGAGVHSPGWYGHLWRYPKDDGTRWMSKVAKLLRKKNMDTSVAHVIEAVRLANALAALRNRSRAGLEELNEAMVTVLGFGDEILLKLISEELIVSDKLGSVPDTVPKVPLLIDVERLQKKYRLSPISEIKDLKLDLREPNDLAKSIFLHRVLLLDVEWGHLTESRSKGTFKEEWQLMWDPEHVIDIIEKGIWGNTLEEAATNYLSHISAEVDTASQLVELLEKSIPTDLPGAVEAMVQKLDTLAAATSDISELMKSVPGLANVVRYGNVRNTDLTALKSMLDSIVVRICIGLHLTCINIDIDAAQEILEMVVKTDYSISLVNDPEMLKQWQGALLKIHGSHQSNPLIAGYTTRLLNDKRLLEYPEVEKQLSYYLSVTNAPADAAYWFEGFLRSSGTVLLLDDNLWNLMNNWITTIVEENFTELLPVLRRTFAEFTQAERRKIGEKAKGMTGGVHKVVNNQENFNFERAEKIVGVVGRLLGL
jgi:hypothetical protein